MPRNLAACKIGNDNSNVILTLIKTNFHVYLIQLWWKFSKIFVNGDVVYAQMWEILTLKTPLSHLIRGC